MSISTRTVEIFSTLGCKNKGLYSKKRTKVDIEKKEKNFKVLTVDNDIYIGKGKRREKGYLKR